MIITPTPHKPFDRIAIDTIGPLPRSENHNVYALTMICELTKYLIVAPIPNKEAKTMAKAIFENLILIHGPVKEIISDKGTEFVNSIVSELFSTFKTSHCISTPYHHESLGSIERNHRVFNEYIRSYLANNTDWENNLKNFQFCYNISPHYSFNQNYSPFELVYNRKPNIPDFLLTDKIEPVYNFDNYVHEARYRLHYALKHARNFLKQSKINNKIIYDKKANPINISIGDQVVLKDETRNKHESLYTGPYVITKIDSVNVEIKNINNNKTKLVHKNNIRKYA